METRLKHNHYLEKYSGIFWLEIDEEMQRELGLRIADYHSH